MPTSPHIVTFVDTVQQLEAVYQRDLNAVKQAKEELDLDFHQQVEPIQAERLRLHRLTEFLTVQVKCLQDCIDNTVLGDIDYWEQEYTQRLKEIVKVLVKDYHNLIAERERLFRQGEFFSIKTLQEKKQEVLRYRDMVEDEKEKLAMLDFRDNLSDTIEALITQITANQQHYSELLNKQTELTENYYLKVANLNSKSTRNEQQLIALQQIIAIQNPIEHACAIGDINTLQKFVDAKKRPKEKLAEIDKSAPEALHIACRFGQVPIVELLLNLGVDPNKPDKAGYYPIHYIMMVVEQEPFENLLLLLKSAKVDVNVKQARYGRTALHTATTFNNGRGTSWLIGQNLDLLNLQETGNFQKNTALHNAAYYGYVDICRFLLNIGALTHLRNHSGRTALMEAFVNPLLPNEAKCQIINCFRQHGYWLSSTDQRQFKQESNYEEMIKPLLKVYTKAMLAEVKSNPSQQQQLGKTFSENSALSSEHKYAANANAFFVDSATNSIADAQAVSLETVAENIPEAYRTYGN